MQCNPLQVHWCECHHQPTEWSPHAQGKSSSGTRVHLTKHLLVTSAASCLSASADHHFRLAAPALAWEIQAFYKMLVAGRGYFWWETGLTGGRLTVSFFSFLFLLWSSFWPFSWGGGGSCGGLLWLHVCLCAWNWEFTHLTYLKIDIHTTYLNLKQY